VKQLEFRLMLAPEENLLYCSRTADVGQTATLNTDFFAAGGFKPSTFWLRGIFAIRNSTTVVHRLWGNISVTDADQFGLNCLYMGPCEDVEYCPSKELPLCETPLHCGSSMFLVKTDSQA